MRAARRAVFTFLAMALALGTIATLVHVTNRPSESALAGAGNAELAGYQSRDRHDWDRSGAHRERHGGHRASPSAPQPTNPAPSAGTSPAPSAPVATTPAPSAPAATTPAPSAPAATPSAPAAPAPSASSGQRVLWGIGDQTEAATNSQIYRQGVANMVTAWYNGPNDLFWMKGYSQPSTLSDLYGAGKSMELVVWLGDHPDYAISDQFQSDISELVTAFKGSGPHYGPLYVVLFSEWETYGKDPAYLAKLKAAYLSAVKRVHAAYSQAEVALGFGGYEWGSTPTRDLSFWQDAIAASDFTAVQAMQACDSVQNGQSILVPQIRSSVQQLGTYGKPVMISHFKLWGAADCQASAFKKFAAEMFTDASLAQLTKNHLFAWNFMGDRYIADTFPSDPTISSMLKKNAG